MVCEQIRVGPMDRALYVERSHGEGARRCDLLPNYVGHLLWV